MCINWKWQVTDLPELLTGDCLAFKGDWMTDLIGAVTEHWALVGRRQPLDPWGGPDWSVVESISKGVSHTLLSRYQNQPMRIYRPEIPQEEQVALAPYIMKRCNYYGLSEYDWPGVTNLGIWFILRHLGIKWWLKQDARFWCIEFVNQVWSDLDFPLCDMAEPPNPLNFENSKQLKLIWGTF